MVIIIDSQIAGISGDMLLCALIDLGANKSKIIEGIKIAAKHLPDSQIKTIDFTKTKKHGIEATELILDVTEQTHERKGIDIQRCIKDSANEINLSGGAKQFAISSINNLINAESKIHGESIDSVHFHEASSIDTVVDILGTAIAIDDLNFDDEIVTTPVAVGGGTLTFSHGTTSNPASAILEIFANSGISVVGGQANDELTTPTGASMLTSLASRCSKFYPTLKVKSIGYGAGKKDFEGFSNVLKIVQGEKTNIVNHDVVQILETNVDDLSGEILGNLIEKIMAHGAKDVTISSAITKKGRPTNLISVICDVEKMHTLLNLLVLETGTLGVRVSSSERYVVPRTNQTTEITIDNKQFTVNYKSTDHNFKIESDDIKSISHSINKSFKQTEELIRDAIKNKSD